MEINPTSIDSNHKFIYGVTTMPDGSKTDNNKKLESEAAKILAEVKDGGMDAREGLAAIDGLMASVDMSAPGAGKLMDKLQSAKESIVKAAEEKASKASAPKEKEEEKKEDEIRILTEEEMKKFFGELDEKQKKLDEYLALIEAGKVLSEKQKEDVKKLFSPEFVRDFKSSQATLAKQIKSIESGEHKPTEQESKTLAERVEKTNKVVEAAEKYETLTGDNCIPKLSPSSTRIAAVTTPDNLADLDLEALEKALQKAESKSMADSMIGKFSDKVSEKSKLAPETSGNSKNLNKPKMER
jgi:hypothetical protein